MVGNHQNLTSDLYHSQINLGGNVPNNNPNEHHIPTINMSNIDTVSQLHPHSHPSSGTTTTITATTGGHNIYGQYQDQQPQELHNVFENNWTFPAYQQSNYQSQHPFSAPSFNSSSQHTDSKLSLEASLIEGKSAKNLYSEEATLDTPSSTASPTYIYQKNTGNDVPSTANEFRKPNKVALPKLPKTKPRTEIVKTEDGQIKVKVKRSRMGCLTCRQRKKRCCETKPNCYECRRLSLNCMWPSPGFEHKNRPKHGRNENEGMHYDPFFGNIKILRGIVEF